ncbi:c-type cytochrome [Chelatococcus sp. GCM10030263]|uniref:c-type cytochrome n=1 Tax=Chelatococcus sp. GCM10030263 TaxID=3273387 RepID=UPI003616EA65
MKHMVFATLALFALAAPAQAQDAAAGEKLFLRCKACHQIGENAKNVLGPELNGVVGRKAASVEGYSYSKGLSGADFNWDEAKLTEWLHNPKKMIPGTKMIFPGFPKDQDVKNVIAYLEQFGPDGKKKTP